MADGMAALIGRQVCIMTRAHRRYTGRLSGWDQIRRVVWVDDVHGHGTEGRCAANGEIEQPANDQVFETIEFNGKDLVDLRLIDDDETVEDKPASKPRNVVTEAQTTTSRPPQQSQQEPWPPAPSQGFPPPPQQQGGFQGPPGPNGPGGPGGPGPYGYNHNPGDRWAPPPPMGGPPHDPRQGPPPPPFGGYGMYGGPQYPPYGAPGGPNFPPPPGGRPFQHEPYPGYPPFPGQAPPPGPPGPPGQQQQFTPQPMAPVEMAEGRQPLQQLPNDRVVEPKTMSTQAPPPVAKASATTSQQKVEQQTPVSQPSSAQTKPAVPVAPTGPKNNGKVIPAMPLTNKPAAREPAKAPVTSSAPAAPARSAVDDATQAATAAVAAAMAKLPPLRQQQQNGQQQSTSNNLDHLARKAGEMRINDNTTRAPRHPNSADAGFGGRGGAPRGGATRGRGGPRQEPRKVEVPKDDFDFESSNAKFNKQDLVKEVIAGDVINETAPLEEEPQETAVPASSYNKKSSFFDDLSSEAKDRADGVASGQTYGRAWRGEEQKRNVETFGQGSVDNGFHRGGMRGRGRGRGGYRGRGGPTYANGQPGRGRGGYQGQNPRQPTPQ